MTYYVALVDGERGAYGAVVPDLPGCTSAADTIDELRRDVIEAVRLWIEDAEADGEDLPRARSLEELRHDPEVATALVRGAALTLVPVLRDYGRIKKANISLDTGLLEAIDAAAEEHGLTRSSFLATAAREKIKEDPVRTLKKDAARLSTLLKQQSKRLERVLQLQEVFPAAVVKRKRTAGALAKKKVAAGAWAKRKRLPSKRKSSGHG